MTPDHIRVALTLYYNQNADTLRRRAIAASNKPAKVALHTDSGPLGRFALGYSASTRRVRSVTRLLACPSASPSAATSASASSPCAVSTSVSIRIVS
jgi:hypothetical protein